jgi:hypothetical protein
MIEGRAQDDEFVLEARMATQAPEIDGVVYLVEDLGNPGDLVDVEITEVLGYDLVARPLPRTRRLRVIGTGL